MKTLSIIVLEEAIKSSLITELETDVSKHPDNTNTGNTNTNTTKTPTPTPGFDGTKIADLIIGSTSWYNDREDDLIAAVKQIKNVSQFFAVNSKIQQKTGKTFSKFIFDEILDEDEWDNIYPIIKHLTDVIPQSQWGDSSKPGPIYNFLKKTTGANEDLKSRNSTLYNKLDKSGALGVVRHSKDFLTTIQSFGYAGLGVIALMVIGCLIGTQKPFCGKVSQWLENRKGKKDIINDINRLEKLWGGYARTNKKELNRIINEMGPDGDQLLTKDEVSSLLKTLEDLDAAALRKAKISIILKKFKQIKKVESGDAKLILQGIQDAKIREELRPYLQAYEDFKLGKEFKKPVKTTDEPNPTITKLIPRKINPKIVTNYPKTSISITDIKKLYELHKSNNLRGAYGFGSPNDQQINDIIEIYEIGLADQLRDANKIKIWKSTRDKWLAAQKIVLGGRDGNLEQVAKQQSGDLKIINKFITDMKAGKASIPQYYLKLEEFPSWKQWMYDHKITRGGTDSDWQKFLTQKFIWDKLQRSQGGTTNYYYTTN